MRLAFARLTSSAAVVLIALVAVSPARAQSPVTEMPLIGEVRALAVAPNNTAMIADLHRRGWLESHGQLLPISDFPDLYKAVGRAWTDASAKEDHFAVPLLADRESDGGPIDPLGVLGGDAITSGQPAHPWVRAAHLSHWIYVGRDLTQIRVQTVSRP